MAYRNHRNSVSRSSINQANKSDFAREGRSKNHIVIEITRGFYRTSNSRIDAASIFFYQNKFLFGAILPI
jgi:hypothetical protein